MCCLMYYVYGLLVVAVETMITYALVFVTSGYNTYGITISRKTGG